MTRLASFDNSRADFELWAKLNQIIGHRDSINTLAEIIEIASKRIQDFSAKDIPMIIDCYSQLCRNTIFDAGIPLDKLAKIPMPSDEDYAKCARRIDRIHRKNLKDFMRAIGSDNFHELYSLEGDTSVAD